MAHTQLTNEFSTIESSASAHSLEDHLFIFGASVRAAAFSALRAKLRPWCVDLFADADLQARCPVQRLAASSYPDGFRHSIRQALPGPWVYTGGLENQPELISVLSTYRELWGNPPSVLAQARSPLAWQALLQASKVPCPTVQMHVPSPWTSERWLEKPWAGAGGQGIRFWTGERQGTAVERPVYYQEYIEGEPWSATYIGDGRKALLVGVTRQLIGESWLHAEDFHYCGSIGPLPLQPQLRYALENLGNIFTSGCGLRGVFGVDGILRGDSLFPVEINPRYTASVEILEYATGMAVLALHRRIFEVKTPLPFAPLEEYNGRYMGKALLFARQDGLFPRNGPWQSVLGQPGPIDAMPAFADVPCPGEPLRKGKPILTFFAQGGSVMACRDALQQRAADVEDWIFRN